MRSIFQGFFLGLSIMASPGTCIALADELSPRLPHTDRSNAQDNSILNFIKANPGCTEFTDGCIACIVINGKPMCSTPGIACIRQDLRCMKRTQRTP